MLTRHGGDLRYRCGSACDAGHGRGQEEATDESNLALHCSLCTLDMISHDIYILYSKHDLVMAVHCFSILHPKVDVFFLRAFHRGPICVSSCLGVWEKIRSQDIDLCKLWICTHSLWYPPCDYWHSWRYARHLWVFAWPSSISTMRSSAVCSSCQSSRSSSRPCTEMPWLLNHLPSPNSLDAKLWPPLDL